MLRIMNLKKLTLIAMTLMSLAATPLMGLGVYASYRCNQNQTAGQNRNLAFNIEDINVGSGIIKSSAPVAGDQFQILISGNYLINYGVQRVNLTNLLVPTGYTLNLIRGTTTTALNKTLVSFNSMGIIVSLQAGDILRVTSQISDASAPSILESTGLTEANTSFITFVKLEETVVPCPGLLH